MRIPVPVLVVALGCATYACATPAPPRFDNAERAYRGLQQAVRARSRAELWPLLDPRTRDTWQVAFRARRASYELLPLLDRDDVANDPELRRLPPLPPARTEELFAASLSDPELAHLGDDLDPKAPVLEMGPDAQVLSATGERVPFRKAGDGTWGFSGLAESARQAAQRELGLLDRIGRLVAVQRPGLLPGSMPWR
jgi:hypothetical protein